MSTRAQQAQLLRNTTFQDQVAGALIYAATQIINESAETANHQDRVKWANAIIADPVGQTKFFLTGMLTNPTIAGAAADPATISDSDVDYVVASLFDTYADQYGAQSIIGAHLQLGQ